MTSYSFLLYALLIINVIAKFFTNYLNIIPRHFNLADIGIVGLFLLFFILYRLKSSERIQFKNILNLFLYFNTILILGAILNSEYINYVPAISQVIMFNESIILFIAMVNLPFSFEHVKTFNKLLFYLIVFEVIIGITQVPLYIRTGESESILGTFQHNAEQYAAFIMVGIFYLMGRVKVVLENRTTNIALIIVMIILVLLIDNKASWLGMVVSILYVLNSYRKISPGGGNYWRYAFIFIMVIFVGYSVANKRSSTLYKYDLVSEAWQSGVFFDIGKLKAYNDIFTAYSDQLHIALIGSGPATFYSRASRQFYNFSEDMYFNTYRDVNDEKIYKASNAMGGVIKKTLREPFFKQYYRDRKIFRIGSGQTDEPFSSYAALMGETGIIGTLIYLGIYIVILKKLIYCLNKYKNDTNILSLITASIGFLIYTLANSIYSNWMETGRMTTILWSMIAMVCKYDELVEKGEAQNI